MEVKRILWPTDMTKESTKVMPMLTAQAANFGATVVVLHVMDALARIDKVANFVGHDEAERLRNALRGDADENLDRICSMLGDTCPNYEKHVVEGYPVEEILKFIGQENIDMVVMPHYLEAPKESYTDPNVSREVFRRAKVPVLSVPV
jgi:nucleotide-binding universal stress UspA family protein